MCLFNVEVLRAKISDAKLVLEVDDDDDLGLGNSRPKASNSGDAEEPAKGGQQAKPAEAPKKPGKQKILLLRVPMPKCNLQIFSQREVPLDLGLKYHGSVGVVQQLQDPSGRTLGMRRASTMIKT